MRLEPTEVQNVVDERREMTSVPVDRLDIALQRGRKGAVRHVCRRTFRDHFTKTDDQVERGAKLVANRRDELILQAAGIVRGSPRLEQFEVDLLESFHGFGEALGRLSQLRLPEPHLLSLALLTLVAGPSPIQRRRDRSQ